MGDPFLRIILIILVSVLFLSGCASYSARTTIPTVEESSAKVATSSVLDDVRPGTILNFQNAGIDLPQRFAVETSYFSALGQRCIIGRNLAESAANNPVTLCMDETGTLKPVPSIQPLAIQP